MSTPEHHSRRDFLAFLGRSSVALSGLTLIPAGTSHADTAALVPLKPSSEDALKLAPGFNYNILIKELDMLSKDRAFGCCNDFTAFVKIPGKNNEALLWVNHESVNTIFASGYNYFTNTPKRSKQQMHKERTLVGGSIVHIKKDSGGHWKHVFDSKYNRRIDANTKIPFASPRPIQKQTYALGTLANCAGGQTPWNSILTCEENYQLYYQNVSLDKGKRTIIPQDYRFDYKWWQHYPAPPEHYGWVVEINPFTGDAKKLTSLGRFSHECATVVGDIKDRCVVYSADDKADQCLYKFIAHKPGSLDEGELFVANIERGEWISLDRSKHKVLEENFKDQTQVQTYTRKAADLVGGSKLDRPEDVEMDPLTGNIYVSLTGNTKKGNLHGSILKISHAKNNHFSKNFTAKTFLTGGKESGFSAPDNMAFDKKGNLWLCCDISEKYLGKGAWKSFKNNGLYLIPTKGRNAGKVLQIASGPVCSELTGISFSPDYRTIFLSVQHPGQGSRSINSLKSHWPGKAPNIPRSAVVSISGPALDKIMNS